MESLIFIPIYILDLLSCLFHLAGSFNLRNSLRQAALLEYVMCRRADVLYQLAHNIKPLQSDTANSITNINNNNNNNNNNENNAKIRGRMTTPFIW